MKRVLIIGVMLLGFAGQSWGQTNFYSANGKPTKIIGEKTVLSFPNSTKYSIQLKDTTNTKTLAPVAVITALLPSAIDLTFKEIGKSIEKNTLSFASEFSARAPYLKDNYISEFCVYRTILEKKRKNEPKDKQENKQKEDTVFIAKIAPVEITGKGTFVFAVKELEVKKSGAKIKPKYDFNDYSIEIKVTYYDKESKEKREMTSSSITNQLTQIGKPNIIFSDCKLDSIKSKPQYLSDQFPINANFIISEIAVKITETNPYKIKSEKIKNFYNDSSESLKEMANSVINLYLPSESKEKGKEESKGGNNNGEVDK